MMTETVIVQDRPFSLEVGLWAQQTDCSVVLRAGKGLILITAVSAPEAKKGIDFFPLTVEYRERASAGGLIPGAYDRREGRASTAETLSSRIIDRSLRPLFPEGYRAETQIVAMVYSYDPDYDLATLAITGASLALSLSDIPWEGPVAAIRVARVDGAFAAFPTKAQLACADMDFIVTVAETGVLMVEGESKEVSEAELVSCLRFAQETLAPVLEMQKRWRKKSGQEKRDWVRPPTLPDGMADAIEVFKDDLEVALLTHEKKARYSNKKAVLKRATTAARDAVDALTPDDEKALDDAVSAFHKRVARDLILDEKRFDGRTSRKVRPLDIQVQLLPSSHGSALFTRGETQALAACTLGGPRDQLRVNSLEGTQHQSFFLHYNFPAFSVGETRFFRGPGRREIGHGMLAQRALAQVLPSQAEFPYTIRVVSDVLASNGSSSMATVCGGSLAMMDAGVPLSAPVAGVAMGLVKEGERMMVLTDILGDEDHLGDMDFKVCGTRKGVTALQMDLKIDGLTDDLLSRALDQAREARIHILDAMNRTLQQARGDVSSQAAKVTTVRVRPERIGDIIGPGGRNIRKLQEETSANIEIDNDGVVRISSQDRKAVNAAVKKLQQATRVPVVGGIYTGTVVRAREYFAQIEVLPGYEGSLHISEVESHPISRVDDYLKLGDTTLIKVMGVDDRGRIKLSRRAAMKTPPPAQRE